MLSALAALVGLTLVLSGTLGDSARAQAAQRTFSVALTGPNENPPVVSPGSAIATLTFDDVTRQLSYTLTTDGKPASGVNRAHIHRGATGINGPIIYTLQEGAPIGTISGVVTLTESDLPDYYAGNLYLNVHSIDFPGGFARGQIVDPAGKLYTDVSTTIAFWNAKNVNAFLAGFTNRGIVDVLDIDPPSAAASALPSFIGEDPVRLISLTNIQINGATATANLLLSIGSSLEASVQSFVLEGGKWKLDAATITASPVAANVSLVDVTASEYSFSVDKSKLASGNFALRVTNSGKEEHELILFKNDTGKPIFDVLAAAGDEDPEGITFIGAVDGILPGSSETLAFTTVPLASGAYAFVCFMPDPQGTPHFLRGMSTDFVVGGSTVALRAPSTGDGGLAGATSDRSLYVVLGGALLLVGFGGAGLSAATARRRG